LYFSFFRFLLGPEVLLQEDSHSIIYHLNHGSTYLCFLLFFSCLASAVDFWALGVCLYQFLVGLTPFTDESPTAIISNIINYRLVWPNDDDEQLDDESMRVIQGLLSYDPILRFQLDGKFIPKIK